MMKMMRIRIIVSLSCIYFVFYRQVLASKHVIELKTSHLLKYQLIIHMDLHFSDLFILMNDCHCRRKEQKIICKSRENERKKDGQQEDSSCRTVN